jgi:hypothetical protein
MTRAARGRDIQRVERDEKLFSLPKLGKHVNDTLLLSYVPHESLVRDPVMFEGVDA